MTADPPLYADLDGTALSTDLLYESFLSAFKRSPWVAVQCVAWLLGGRARLKEELAALIVERAARAASTTSATAARTSRCGTRAAMRALRPHQWAKNLLVFVPLIASHRLGQAEAWMLALAAFVSFCLLASSAYLLTDLLDLPPDRAHRRKRQRALASGELPIPAGAVLFDGGPGL
jgi:hypothetical protein